MTLIRLRCIKCNAFIGEKIFISDKLKNEHSCDKGCRPKEEPLK